MTKLQAAVDKASEDKPDLTTFIGRLQHLGVDVLPMISDQGRKRISYRLEDLKVRGSKLHNASIPKLISQRGVDFDLRRDKPAMDAAANGQRVSIPIEKQVAWSEIDLMSYLPSAFHNDLTTAQAHREQNKSQLTDDVKDEETNTQQTRLTDPQLLSIKSNVDSWHKLRPREPSREIIQSIELYVNKLKRLLASGQQRINYQKIELEQLARPRSLLNPFGVTRDVIEQKKTQIQLNQSKLKDIERSLTTANNNLERWQKKVQAYQDFSSSPKTQEMQKLAQLLLAPDNIARLDRIEEGHKIYDSAWYILKQLGSRSGEVRSFQGEFYRIEKQNQTLTISRLDDDSILYMASDGRESVGIIEIKEFNLSQQDKERLDESVRYLKHQQKSKQKSGGFSIG